MGVTEDINKWNMYYTIPYSIPRWSSRDKKSNEEILSSGD